VQEKLGTPNVVEGTYLAQQLTVESQRKILALVCRKQDYLPRFHTIIKPSYFHPSEIRVDICRLALDYYRQYKVGPTIEAVVQMVTTLVSSDHEKYKIHPQYWEELNALNVCSFNDEQFITDEAIEFATAFELYQSGTKLKEAMLSRDRTARKKAVMACDAALRIGADKKDIGSKFSDGNWILNPPRRGILGTGVQQLDQHLSGGLARGEMGVIAAPRKRFKSGALINIAKAAMLFYGYTVVHMSMELTQAEVEDRYARCLLGAVRGIHTQEYMGQLLREFLEKNPIKLICKHWSMGTLELEQQKDYLRNLVSLGEIEPGGKLLLISDYPGIMRERRGQGMNRTTEMQDNYRGQIQIAQEFDCPIWCAAQMSGDALKKDVPTDEDLSWCRGIAADAHAVLTLCQSVEEYEAKKIRIFTAIVRAGRMHQIVPMQCDPETTWRWFET